MSTLVPVNAVTWRNAWRPNAVELAVSVSSTPARASVPVEFSIPAVRVCPSSRPYPLAAVAMSIGRDKIDYKYETWRLAHGLGALLIAALLLHHTLSAGRYAQDPALIGVWIGLFLVALLTLAWVYVVEPLRQRLLELSI